MSFFQTRSMHEREEMQTISWLIRWIEIWKSRFVHRLEEPNVSFEQRRNEWRLGWKEVEGSNSIIGEQV
jgi:hypothetical protein